ncbi:MAG: hypothetical protein Fur0012_06920 [Elusimicrobiota bacterium]
MSCIYLNDIKKSTEAKNRLREYISETDEKVCTVKFSEKNIASKTARNLPATEETVRYIKAQESAPQKAEKRFSEKAGSGKWKRESHERAMIL